MTGSPITDKIELHERLGRQYAAQADALEGHHGTGVRPGWVSTEVSLARRAQGDHEAMASFLRHFNERLENKGGEPVCPLCGR